MGRLTGSCLPLAGAGKAGSSQVSGRRPQTPPHTAEQYAEGRFLKRPSAYCSAATRPNGRVILYITQIQPLAFLPVLFFAVFSPSSVCFFARVGQSGFMQNGLPLKPLTSIPPHSGHFSPVGKPGAAKSQSG